MSRESGTKDSSDLDGALPVRRICIHAAWFSAFFLFFLLLASGLFSFYLPSPTGDAGEKLAYYGRHRGDYDLVFIGDSRTYTGMQPDEIDALLGTRSYNLSAFAWWFPTQVPAFEKLARLVPEDTTVVWSVGHQNFFPVFTTVNERYPIGVSNVPRYISWGFTTAQIMPNLLYYNPAGGIVGRGAGVRKKIEDLRLYPLSSRPPPAAAMPDAAAGSPEAVAAAWRKRPEVLSAGFVRDGGEVRSIRIIKNNGAYLRVEVDGEYHRRMQLAYAAESQSPAAYPPPGIAPDEAYWNCFLAVLDAFESEGVRLVVSEFEEAPQQYVTPDQKERWRLFMRETVQAEVESRGFPYLRVDFDLFSPSDYFDYNHLNSDGTERFTPLFTDLLLPLLERR